MVKLDRRRALLGLGATATAGHITPPAAAAWDWQSGAPTGAGFSPDGESRLDRLIADKRAPFQPSSTLKIVTVGDSIIQFSHIATAKPFSRLDNQADGEIMWAQMASPGFRHVVWPDETATRGAAAPLFRGANFALAGDTATGIAGRLAPVINSRSQIAIVSVGTNIGTTDSTASATIASLRSIVEGLTGAGMHVILGTIRPRVVTEFPVGIEISPASMQRIMEVNNWIRLQGSDNVTCWDPWDDLVDPGAALAGNPLPGMLRDAVHLAPRGAFASAKSLRRSLASLIAVGTWFDANPTIASLISNGALTGNSGRVGKSSTGVMPDDWSILNTAGAGQIVTAVSSLAPNAETGGQILRVNIASAGGGSSSSNIQTIRLAPISVNVAGAGLNPDDWVQWFVELEVDASEIVGSFQATMQVGVPIARGLGFTINDRASEPFPNEAWRGWIQTEAVQVGEAMTLVPRLDLDTRIDVEGSAQVRVKRALLRVVDSSEELFPYMP